MKKSTILFSAALAVVVGSSFTQANSSRLDGLNSQMTNQANSGNVKELRGYKSTIVLGSSATAFPGTINNQVTVETNAQVIIVSDPGTGTGKMTKLEKLINTYK